MKSEIEINIHKVVGAKIAQARKTCKLNQDELAEMIKLSRTSVTNIEKGRQTLMLSTLIRLSIALNCDVLKFIPTFKLTDIRDELKRINKVKRKTSEAKTKIKELQNEINRIRKSE